MRKATELENRSYSINKNTLLRRIVKSKMLLIMLIPGVLYTIIFNYIPIFGTVVAFQDYSVYKGVFKSEWVGLFYFKSFMQSPFFFRLLKNTFLISFYGIVASTPAAVVLALSINELKKMKLKKVIQTATYIPYFVSITIMVGMVKAVLSPTEGIVNKILVDFFSMDPIFFMGDPRYFRPIYILSGLWQGLGFGTIVYLAAITGVNPQLYEACFIDGGGRLKQMWHVTLPSITSTIVMLLILSIGKMLNIGAEKIVQMYNPLTYETADVFATYVYRVGLQGGEFSLGTAVDVFNNVAGIILLLLANKIAKRVSEHSLW